MIEPRKIPDGELESQALDRREVELRKRERLAIELELARLAPLARIDCEPARPKRRGRPRKDRA